MESNLRFNFPNNHISFILYFSKCNCKCFYCDLDKIFINCIKYDEESLKLSLPFIDSLVISGGEPLLAFNDVLKFQQFAKDNDLWFYVYTNGYDVDKINKLLKLYDKTKIVIDIKGNNINEINETTQTSFGSKIMETYNTFKHNDNVIFRINDLINITDINFNNIERYELIR